MDNHTCAFQCLVCRDMFPRKIGTSPTVCWSCAKTENPRVETDMNVVEEYIQGDHGYVISNNY